MQLDLPRSRAGRGIGLTPLIDVVFILLLFFLLASHFNQWRALGLDTATANTSARDDTQPPALLLRVHADGTLDINGEPLSLSQLKLTLEDYRARRPELSVVLEADVDVRLQPLVGVIDRVTAAGIRELSLK